MATNPKKIGAKKRSKMDSPQLEAQSASASEVSSSSIALSKLEKTIFKHEGESKEYIGICITFTSAVPSSITKAGFLKVQLGDRTVRTDVLVDQYEYLQSALKIGKRTLCAAFSDICPKGASNPGATFDVYAEKVLFPANMDSTADMGGEKILKLINLLQKNFELKSENSEIPKNVSEGSSRNFINALEYLCQVISRSNDGVKMTLNTGAKLPIISTLASMIIFKWANEHKLVPYMKKDVTRGNISEIAFRDICASWGTPIAGNILQRFAGFIYDVCNIIAKRDIKSMIPKSLFIKAQDILDSASPKVTRTVKLGHGKKVKTEERIIPLPISHPETIRWLFSSERAVIKDAMKPLLLTNKSKDFEDNIESHSVEEYRDYFERTKKLVAKHKAFYYAVRRVARLRLNAIKALRRALKQSELLNDSEFKDDGLSTWFKSNIDTADVNNKELLKKQGSAFIILSLITDELTLIL